MNFTNSLSDVPPSLPLHRYWNAIGLVSYRGNFDLVFTLEYARLRGSEYMEGVLISISCRLVYGAEVLGYRNQLPITLVLI